MDPYVALFLLGVIALIVAAVAFISDLALTLWARWDERRRAQRIEDREEWRRVLERRC